MPETNQESNKDFQEDFEINQKFKKLLESSGCQQAALVIDIEGVIFPFHFSADSSTGKLSFVEGEVTVQNSRDSNFKSRRLPTNHRIIEILTSICKSDSRTLVVPGSQLNLGKPEVLNKIDPIYHSAMDGAEAIMKGMVSRDGSRMKSLKPSSEDEKIPDNSLLIIVNDRIEDDGNPPKTITNALRNLPAANTLKMVQVMVPQFPRDLPNKDEYTDKLYKSFVDGFSKEASPIPAMTKVSKPLPSYDFIPARKIIRRPGD